MEIARDNKFEEDVILDYFKALRREIDLRIKLHSYYSISKIITCGILFSLFIKTNAWGILAVPLVAISLDIWIAHNLITINNMGQYIQNEFSKHIRIFSHDNTLKIYKKSHSHTPQERIVSIIEELGHLFITTAFTLASAWFIYSDSKFSGWYLLLSVFTILFLDGTMFWFSRATKQTIKISSLGYLAMVAIFTLVSFWFIYSASRISGWYLLPTVLIIFSLSLLVDWSFNSRVQSSKRRKATA